MCVQCVSKEMAAKIELVQGVAGEWSDGAFFAYCEENGVDATDLEAYYDTHADGKGKDEAPDNCGKSEQDGTGG